MKVVFNLIAPLARLETQNGRRYTVAEMSRQSKVNRQTIRNLINESPEQINVSTLAGLLDFFAAEGMPITVNDLFIVTTESPENPPES